MIANLRKKQVQKTLLTVLALAAAMALLGGCGNDAQAVNGAMDIDLSTLPQEIVDPASWSEDPEAIYLIAELPEDDIYLYGMGDKSHVLLRQGEQRALLDWSYITPRLILPEMCFGDFDGDGSKELAVSLSIASGTGASIEELHIVSWRGVEADDCRYDAQDYLDQLEEMVNWRYDASAKKATLHCGYLDVYLPDGLDTDYSQYQDTVNFGSAVDFTFTGEGKIKAAFALGLTKEGQAEPDYIGAVTAQILYNKGKISMDPNTMFYMEE